VISDGRSPTISWQDRRWRPRQSARVT